MSRFFPGTLTKHAVKCSITNQLKFDRKGRKRYNGRLHVEKSNVVSGQIDKQTEGQSGGQDM